MEQMHVVDDLINIKSIGKGNYGEVFLSKKKGLPQLLATKKMNRQFSSRAEYEIRIIMRINHPNIVRFIDLKKTKNNWYLVTEYCNGSSLLDNLKSYMNLYQKPFSEEIIQYLMRQIVDAIQYLHLNKIIHRDLKLDNILVNFPTEYDKTTLNMMNCTVKLIDFGFATTLGENKPYTCTALGTPHNMDPIILENVETGIPNVGYNEKVDIWSLGTLCYEMAVGHPAFEGNNIDEIFQSVKKGTYPLPITLSREIASFINSMLQQDPNKRLSADQLMVHDFLTKDTIQFRPIGNKKIPGSTRVGDVIYINSKYNEGSQYKIVDDKQNLFSLETDETNENYITNDTTQYQAIDEGQITGIIGTEPITNINIISPQIIDDNNLLMETFDQTNINQNNYQAENFVPIESVIEISSQPYEYIEEYKEAL